MVQTRHRLHQHDLSYDCEGFTSHHTADEILNCKLTRRYGVGIWYATKLGERLKMFNEFYTPRRPK